MKRFATATIMLMASISPAFAETIEVEMLNKNEAGDRMVFSQELIRAEVGDVIRFVPTDKAHNAQSVRDALPEGQEPFRGRMNQAVEYVVTETGLTAVICQPHQAMGMVALVVVGDDLSNAEQILDARIPGKGGEKIKALVEEAQSTIAAETEEQKGNS
jgi:pseudoazurin